MPQLSDGENRSLVTQEMAASMTDSHGSIDFFEFLRRSISIEMLLADRVGQATLARLLSFHATRDKDFVQAVSQNGGMILINPNPIVELQQPDGTSWNHDAFQLQDREYYYYFAHGNPGEQVPPYLRSEDVVASHTDSQSFPQENVERAMKELGISAEMFEMLRYNDDPRIKPYRVLTDIPFNKPINRVLVTGGRAERYNYNTKTWEDNGEGEYKPDMVTRIRETALQAWRRRPNNQRRKHITALPKLEDK